MLPPDKAAQKNGLNELFGLNSCIARFHVVSTSFDLRFLSFFSRQNHVVRRDYMVRSHLQRVFLPGSRVMIPE